MRSSHKKGKAHELEVVHVLRPLFPGAKRGCSQSRNERVEEDNKADVEGTTWWVECSHSARHVHVDKLEQAHEATDGRRCVAVTRLNRGRNIAHMYLEDFVLVMREIEVLRVLREAHPVAVAAAEQVVLGRGNTKHEAAE